MPEAKRQPEMSIGAPPRLKSSTNSSSLQWRSGSAPGVVTGC